MVLRLGENEVVLTWRWQWDFQIRVSSKQGVKVRNKDLEDTDIKLVILDSMGVSEFSPLREIRARKQTVMNRILGKTCMSME